MIRPLIIGRVLPPIEESYVGDVFMNTDTGIVYTFDDGAWQEMPQKNREVPSPTQSDNGKAVVVGDDGKYTLGTVSGGGASPFITIAESGDLEWVEQGAKALTTWKAVFESDGALFDELCPDVMTLYWTYQESGADAYGIWDTCDMTSQTDGPDVWLYIEPRDAMFSIAHKMGTNTFSANTVSEEVIEVCKSLELKTVTNEFFYAYKQCGEMS